MINKKHILNNRYFCKNDENYFIVKLNNKRFAIPDKCPHRGGPLSLGNICRESQRIQCPWHDGYFKISSLIKNAIPAVCVKDQIFYI
ncbi:hypothetical protein D7286_04075 [Legionella pneumophila]|uniref:Rieske 2Fe-2S domain-containing protein n=1 Tax=Legionella pneumophila TaxID=446 RepID=UPI001011CC8B|nr:Rieske 2Fe-2S domain-containing protein [Legionella pneumophila]RYB77189.1 hypothetical protein D7286_04075 [Legionella pneumophila]